MENSNILNPNRNPELNRELQMDMVDLCNKVINDKKERIKKEQERFNLAVTVCCLSVSFIAIILTYIGTKGL